jgi:anaerobic magnesium-protoporphyrin IX monomethyl ester cyclase
MAKVVFIQNIWYEQLGIAHLASVLKRAGHQVDLFVEDAESDFIESLRRVHPDLVAFSCTTGVHVWAQGLAREIKQSLGLPIIMGGAHPTFFPQVINNPDIDIICRGEGEAAIVELADRMSSGRDYSDIPGLWVKRDGDIIRNDLALLEENLDRIPFPDREIYYRYEFFRRDTVRYFITGRGCPFACTYCYNLRMRQLVAGKGRYLRQRSVDNVISELVEVRDHHNLKTVYFVDDTLFLDRSWSEEFLERYRAEVRLPFICNTKAALLREDLVAQLKRSYCYSAQFGIETGDEDLRRKLLHRSESNDDIIAAARRLKAAGIRFRTFNMLGLPGETLDNAWETMRLNAIIKTDSPLVTIFQPYPGTALADYAAKLGFLDADFGLDQMDATYFRSSVLQQPKIKEIQNLHKLFLLAIRCYGLRPLWDRLIRLPLGRFYYLILLFSLALQYTRATRRSWWQVLLLGLRNLSFFRVQKRQV